MPQTTCLFHVPGHLHSSCVTAQQFGPVFLVRDIETMYWVDQAAIDQVAKFAAREDDENYDAWCRANGAAVSGFGGDGSYGIRDVGPAEFLAACRETEAKIEAAGGIEYAALVDTPSDDEAYTEVQRERDAEAAASIASGDGISHAEILREFGLQAERGGTK